MDCKNYRVAKKILQHLKFFLLSFVQRVQSPHTPPGPSQFHSYPHYSYMTPMYHHPTPVMCHCPSCTGHRSPVHSPHGVHHQLGPPAGWPSHASPTTFQVRLVKLSIITYRCAQWNDSHVFLTAKTDGSCIVYNRLHKPVKNPKHVSMVAWNIAATIDHTHEIWQGWKLSMAVLWKFGILYYRLTNL